MISFLISLSFITNLIFAQEPSFTIPGPALPGLPGGSLFLKIKLPGVVEPPAVLNLISRRSIVIPRNRFVKELRTIALKSPFSFMRLKQNSVVFLSTLKGLIPSQVVSMSIFCLKEVAYYGKFANQIILPITDDYPDNTECLVALEYKEKGSGDVKTLENKFLLPKPR